MPGQEPRKGDAPGRAVNVDEPGGRLAEELKVMQVSASAQGGKESVGFIIWYYSDLMFYYKITFRYYINKIILKIILL